MRPAVTEPSAPAADTRELIAEYGAHSHTFSLAKAFTYRFLGTTTTIAIAYVLTEDISIGMKAGLLEFCSKIFLHYFHNQLWVWGIWTWSKRWPSVRARLRR